MVIPGNQYIQVICTYNYKIALFEAIQIYSYVKMPGWRLQCKNVIL